MANTGYGACEDVLGSTRAAVDKRKELTSGATTWHAKRKPWIKAYTCSSSPQTLGAGGSSITSLYHTSGVSKGRPKPGITGFSCQEEGTHGGFRTATLNFTCWTKEDFDKMSKAFLWYGVTVMVEWGWSVSQNGSAVSEKGGYPDCSTQDFDLVKQIQGHIAAQKACYESLRGTVVDFKWNLGENGSFECECEINSMAQCPAKTPIKTVTKDCGCTQDDEEQKDPTFNSLSVLNGAIKDCSKDSRTKSYGGSQPGAISIKASTADDESTNVFTDVWRGVSGFFGAGKEDFTYISFEVFEEWVVNQSVLPLTAAGGSSGGGAGSNPGISRDDALGMVDGASRRASWSSSGKKFAALFMSHHSRLRGASSPTTGTQRFSGDPTVCLLPGSSTQKYMTDAFEEHDAFDGLGSCFDGNTIALPDIMLNCTMIQEEFDKCTKDTSAGEFMQAVLSRVNEACGGLWNFTMVPLPNCEAVTQWLDIDKQHKGVGTITIPSFGKDSVCRNVTSKTESDPDLRAQIMLSANTNAGKGNNSTGGGIRLWAADVTDTFNDGMAPDEECDPTTLPDPCTKKNPGNEDDEPSIEEVLAKVGKEVNPERVAAAKAISRRVAMGEDGPQADESSDVFVQPVPIGVDIEMDGIGGFRFGNLVVPSYLPAGYDDWAYQVTSVNHKVNNADWTTTLECGFMRKK